MARSRVDLPTPLGPRIATNSPAATLASTPDQIRRPPSAAAARRSSTTGTPTVLSAMVRFFFRPGRRPAGIASELGHPAKRGETPFTPRPAPAVPRPASTI